MSRSGSNPATVSKPKTRRKITKPPMFRVLLHNDDYTSMDFVVEILRSIFCKDETEAVQIMLNVHYKGIGVAGLYPAQLAETKVRSVHSRAKENGYPLRCSMEPE